MRELRPGTVIAVIALFIAIGGTATAASGLINGSKIKPGTVTARQIKNQTITTSKLAPATVASLRGARGPVGATGPAGENGQPGTPGQPGQPGAVGATGATGATGADGVVEPYMDQVLNFNLPTEDFTIPLSIDLPPGQYLLTAKTNVVNQYASGDNMIECTIWTDEVDGVDRATSDVPYNRIFNLSAMAVADVQGLVELRCVAWNGPAQLFDTKLIAQPIQG
ncbi:MAG TPA: collagen-like protein [Solirubrobacterales bacterium]|nr:collagen-like protein [Solirubrobacterales bacterium]HMU25832.1 collagen-like protein [Solirubrobacterales bacterium]HMY24814.1 collagen-like protein [Solirubrobacterales bacterium]HNA24583.1 collagen-like protein [Solirubrobacterales bacterium]HNC04727.1 collagen-like protein [Solirubrobacterales bacterium]